MRVWVRGLETSCGGAGGAADAGVVAASCVAVSKASV